MDTPAMDDFIPTFYIGQHESKRSLPITEQVLQLSQDCNYDMLTTPITTPHFQSRVLALLSNYLSDSNDRDHVSLPTLSSLSQLDTSLAPGGMIPHLLAFVSPWIDLSSSDPVIYSISRQVLELELAYAAFCGFGNVLLPSPKLHHGKSQGDGIVQYALAIQEALGLGNYLQIVIRLPIIDYPEEENDDVYGNLAHYAREEYVIPFGNSKPRKPEIFGTWDAWNIIRTVCNYSTRLFVALSLPRHLPPLNIQTRWGSEPVRLLSLDARTFLRNPGGYPVLSQPHRTLITRYMRIRNPPWILLCDVGPIPGLENSNAFIPAADGLLSPSASRDADQLPTPAEAAHIKNKIPKKQKDPTPHLSYIRNLQRKQPPRTDLERYSIGYQDYLQAPLQPLTDNLESVTYEVFEKDPIKYNLYEKAISLALEDWVKQGKPASGSGGRVTVAIVGAGRGPLVSRAIKASEAVGVEIELWAIEKNPNAFVLLQRHNEDDWNGRVNLVKSDMRSWKGPLRQTLAPENCSPQESEDRYSIEETYHEPLGKSSSSLSATAFCPSTYCPIDILVSELLGSFADNELSPECLDGVLPLLNPTHGLSIPASYTAYLSPINAPKLHADISARSASDPLAPNTPYVVMLHAIDHLSSITPPATSENAASPVPNIYPVWSFTHGPSSSAPPLSSNKHNTRHVRLTFRTRDRGVCHGLAGYFEAVLYPGVELSTNPITMEAKSAGMMSWFPIFFPLKTPLYLPDHGELTVTMMRCTDNRKVWYDWVVESWGWNLMIGGEKRRVRLGGGEVGSSKLAGCMM